MDKATKSVLTGLIVIVIIIQSTLLMSMFHPGSGLSGVQASVKTISVVTPTDTSSKATFLAAPTQAIAITSTIAPVVPATNESIRLIKGESVSQQPTILPVSKIDYVHHEDPIVDERYNTSDHLVYVPVPRQTLDEPDYVEIFNSNMSFAYNSTAISFNLINAPMKISYNVTPMMASVEKWVINRDAGEKLSDGKIINVTRFDEDSWFKLTVFDKDANGTIVMRDGFGNGYDQSVCKDIVIRNPGNYQLKFEGSIINVMVSVEVPREGNIVT
jgi:hypothetical protein